MATHSLTADTRMEDIAGLASGDTISLAGCLLTCESDMSAVSGLFLIGTGTVRMLDGGYANFNAVQNYPSTITIEGGTEANPLPSHGNHGYPFNASAFFRTNRGEVGCNVVSHCLGNAGRVQHAVVASVFTGGFEADRNLDWDAGDWVGWKQDNGSVGVYPMVLDGCEGRRCTYSTGTAPRAGAHVILMTAGFAIGTYEGHVSNSGVYCSNSLSGGEIGLLLWRGDQGAAVRGARVSVGRLVTALSVDGGVDRLPLFGGSARGRVGGVCGIGRLVNNTAGSSIDATVVGPLEIGRLYGMTVTPYSGCARVNMKVLGGVILGTAGSGDRVEFADCELPATLYSTLSDTAELVVRTSARDGRPPTCVIHRAGGIATLVDRMDIEVPTSLPDAWRLDPIEDGTAWHDVPMTVLPGKTLSAVWYWMLGEEGAAAGSQILDGETTGWGAVAMNPGMADVLAETATPVGASPLRPFASVPINWRNTSREIRKVVLRGWARGGTAYSRIDPAAGGLA